MEPPGGHGDAQPEPPGPVPRLELDLVDREAQVVEPADPCLDGVAVAGPQVVLGVELVPEGTVAAAHPFGRADGILEVVAAVLEGGEVGQPEGDVLDEDLEVVGALAVGQRRVDLARLGIDEERLDLVAVAPEEGVGERAVAPVHAGPVEVDQEGRHRVEQAIPVRDRSRGQSHQQPPVLQRMGEVGGHEDGRRSLGRLGQADGLDRRQLDRLEVAEDLVLAPGDLERLLLEGVQPVVVDEEADEVPRGPDRQLAQVVVGRGPVREGALPGQPEQTRRGGAKSKVREGRGGGEVAQSRFRR